MDFAGFTFRGTVTLDHVVFSGEETTFLDARFDGGLRCHGTEFSATTTRFSRVTFGGPAGFFRARFATTLYLSGTSVDGGKIEFEECLFEGAVRGLELEVVRGALRFERCVFENAQVTFPYSTIGPSFDHRRWYDVLLGRDEDPGRGGLSFVGCELVDSSVLLDDVFLERGQIVVTDLTLRGGLLRIRPVGAGSFVMLRRIDVQDGEVDVPEQFWKGRAPEDAPQRSERDGHGGVGHDGADVREEL
jgi:hypothetical protein